MSVCTVGTIYTRHFLAGAQRGGGFDFLAGGSNRQLNRCFLLHVGHGDEQFIVAEALFEFLLAGPAAAFPGDLGGQGAAGEILNRDSHHAPRAFRVRLYQGNACASTRTGSAGAGTPLSRRTSS